MNDDIVTLMRTDIQECDCNFRNAKCFLCIIEMQAADEIERLRAKNQMLLGVIGLLKQADEKE